MSKGWDFWEGTEKVHRLLRDLSQDLQLWGRFFDDPLSVIEDYGLFIPEGIIQDNLHFRKKPSAALFSSEMDWEAFKNTYLGDGRETTSLTTESHHTSPGIETEILLTLNNAKPATRVIVGDEDLETFIPFLEEKRTPFVLSPYKVTEKPDDKKGSYINLVDTVLPIDSQSKGRFFVYISSDGAKAQAALLFDTIYAGQEFGRILGYPECCVEFFVRNFAKTQETQGDLVSLSLHNTPQCPPYSLYLNNLARYFGVQLISHFPCRYTCAASAALGKRHLAALERDAPGLAEKIRKCLMCPVVYTDTEGVFLLEESYLQPDGCLAFDPDRIVATDETTNLYRLLRSADRLKMTAWNRGRLALYRGDELIEDVHPNVWCLTFTDGLY